jgi:hypothetical protein
MIQLYEQRQNDISKAQVSTPISLSKVLYCKIDDLIESDVYFEYSKEILTVDYVDSIWNRIVEHQGQTFFTVRKIPYTYHISGNQICLENTNRNTDPRIQKK